MKKLIAALAVLAVAAAAQAELLATWSQVNGVVSPGENAKVTASNLKLEGAAQWSGSNVAGMNNLTTDGSGFSFTVTLADDIKTYQITEAVIAGQYSGSTTGPKQMDWYVGTTPVTDGKIVRDSQGGSFSQELPTLSDGATVSLLVNTAAGRQSDGAALTNTAGSFIVRTTGGGMTLNGKVTEATSVPEPATMSLLGLGALAMVLRRKLRK